MKKLALAAVLSAAATTAFAGNIIEPVIEPVIEPTPIVEDTPPFAGGILIPILAAGIIAAVLASD
ncbi:MAG: hypothetical protein AAF264_09825 [Pseudomonadota bacterium]